MKPNRITMEIIVDVDHLLNEQAVGHLLRSLQEIINNAIMQWERPTFVREDEIKIRTTGWS